MGQKHVPTKCQIYLKTNCISECGYRVRVCHSWGLQGAARWAQRASGLLLLDWHFLPGPPGSGSAGWGFRAVTDRNLAHRGLDRRKDCLISSQPDFFSSVLAGEMGLRQRPLGFWGEVWICGIEDHRASTITEQALTPNSAPGKLKLQKCLGINIHIT